MTAAPLSWHHTRAHNNQFTSDAHQLTTVIPTGTATQVTKSNIVSVWKDRRCGGKTCCFLRKNKNKSKTKTKKNSGTPERWPDSVVLFMFGSKMATESAVEEILWLTSAVCAVSAVQLNSDGRWRLTVTALWRGSLWFSVWPYGVAVALWKITWCFSRYFFFLKNNFKWRGKKLKKNSN